MKRINKTTKKVISVTLVLIFSMSSILLLFPLNPTISESLNQFESEEKSTEMKSPSLSIIGEDEWWNSTFYHRQLINITNPYGEAFTNFIANITFNYTTLVSDGKMNESLKDVRIVENGILRDYFIEKDYPEKDLATIWFETDISAGPNKKELDTYLYYGNENASFASSYLMSKNPDGLIWYKFEGITNQKIIDIMGNYNATVKGNPQIIGGGQQAVGDNCLELDQNDGTNDYLAIENKYYQGHNQIPELTICVWYKTSETTGTWTNNWAFFDFDRSEYFNFFIRPDNGRLGFSSAAAPAYNSYNDQVTTTQNLNDGSWHFGCAKYDGTDKYLYLDNGVEDTGARALDPHNGNPIGVGDDADYGGTENNDDPRYGFIGDGSEATSEDGSRNNLYYHGSLDEIRYFEESLSPERIYWIANNYKLNISLNEIQNKEATIEVIVKDIDGRGVPGASVFIFNSTDNVNYTQITNQQGYTEFGSLENLLYYIRVNYTIINGSYSYEEVVYDSSLLPKIFDFTGLFYTVYIEVNLWSIDFEIEDWEYEPMGYGYVLVYNKSDYTELIANLTLNKEFGTQTFRGINTSLDAKYYYDVYYDNADYNQQQTIVNRSVVERTEYLNTNFNMLQTINVNETDRDERDEYFLVQERFYASGSNDTHIGNTKIINSTIIMSKMDDHLDRIDIYTIDSYNNVSSAPIYSYEYTSETQDTIKLNITEFADTFGLFMHIEGTNSTLNCNGIIDVNYNESCNKYVRVNMSKLSISVYDTLGALDPIPNVYIHVINGSGAGTPITTLLTNDLGIAKGIKNPELDFWYITNILYNFSIEYFDIPQVFNVTSDQYTTPQGTFLDEFNYTLTKKGFIEFRILLNLENYTTQFDTVYWDSNLEWGSNFFFEVQFLSTTNALDQPPTWTPVTDPDYVTWEIKDKYGDVSLFSGSMNKDSDGYFNYTFDSLNLIGNEDYLFKVYGAKKGFQDPAPASMYFTVAPKNTNLRVYNTADMTYLGNNVTLYYGEKIGLTVLYTSYAINLTGATITYDWQFIDTPIVITEKPSGVYSFEINTSIADVGTYKIDINAPKQNYSSQYFRFDVVIVNRPTSLNDDISLHHISKILWVRQAYNFTFEYKDTLSEPHANLIDLDQAIYQWYEVSANGSIVGAISNKIDLIAGPNSTYILDFNTASKEVGYYALFVTMQKNNYEVRIALIDLSIQKRIMTLNFTATNLVQNQIKIIQGEDVYLELILTDLADPADPQSIIGATVTLVLGSQEYELTDIMGNGTYFYTFTSDNIDAFFAAQVFTGEISISKEDFISDSIPITIVVGITEIFPGFPMFYFLMIVGSVVAIVGSLATYRIVQQRRIPTFVKKARTMKKSIKSNKPISDSLLYPSKEEFIVKKLGEKWDAIGLSLEDILGVKEKKKIKIPEAKEVKYKGGAD
ncbi:MAG: LamG-like jellyroll fold domain-containing protein [Candidatus Lokiarchaeia archaeon]